jgi:hypothetical protein
MKMVCRKFIDDPPSARALERSNVLYSPPARSPIQSHCFQKRYGASRPFDVISSAFMRLVIIGGSMPLSKLPE